jgi:hypothetical protein
MSTSPSLSSAAAGEFIATSMTPGYRPAPVRPPRPSVAAEDGFVGRQHELDTLDSVLQQVRDHGFRVVLLEGPAG